MVYVEVAPWTSVQGISSTAKTSEFTPNLKVWGSIASTLRQRAKPLDGMAALVYSMPAL